MTYPNEISSFIEKTTRLHDITDQVLQDCGWETLEWTIVPISFGIFTDKMNKSLIWSNKFKDQGFVGYFTLFNHLNSLLKNGAKVILLYDTVIDKAEGDFSIYWHYVQIRNARIDRNENVELIVWDYGISDISKLKKIKSGLKRFVSLYKRIWVFY